MNKKTQKQGTWKLVIGGMILAILIAILGIVYFFFAPKTTEGTKTITLTVVDDTKTETTYPITTDAEFLGEALEAVEGLEIEGTKGDYGIYIDAVNGLYAKTADSSGTYWAIYVNGEYGQYSLDTQPITDQDTYALVYETY